MRMIHWYWNHIPFSLIDMKCFFTTVAAAVRFPVIVIDLTHRSDFDHSSVVKTQGSCFAKAVGLSCVKSIG